MLSTYQLFKNRNSERPRRIEKPLEQGGLFPKQPLSAQQKISREHLRDFLLPTFDLLKRLERAIEMFNRYLNGYPEEEELKRLAGYICSAMRECFEGSEQQMLKASQLVADFIESNNLKKLKECAWAKDLQVANDFSVRYLSIAFVPTVEEIWQLYSRNIGQQNINHAVALSQNIIVATLFYINVNIKIAEEYISLFEKTSRVDLSLGMEKKAARSLSIVEENVEGFFSRLLSRDLLEGVLVYAFDKYLFDSYMLRGKLAIRRRNVKELSTYAEKIHEIKARGNCKVMRKGYSDLRNAEAQLKQRIRHEENSPREKSTASANVNERSKTKSNSTSNNLNTSDNSSGTIEDNGLLEMVSTNNVPKCYQLGTALGQQIDSLGDLMEKSGIDGYINGSSIYKSNPGDIDIVFVNMSMADSIEKFKEFFASLADQGALIPRTYYESLGHVKDGLQIISISWLHTNYKKVDVVLWEGSLQEHAMRIDKTIAALYYCPRSKVTYRTNNLTSLADLQRRKIHFHGDAVAKLLNDPDIIFMNLKLHFEEGFNLSAKSWDAILEFARQVDHQIFNKMLSKRLFSRLKVLLSYEYQLGFMDCLVRLELFDKLYYYLAEDNTSDGVGFFNVLHNYHFHAQQVFVMQYATNSYQIPFGAYAQGFSCNFYREPGCKDDLSKSIEPDTQYAL